jgi:hypothetical protein
MPPTPAPSRRRNAWPWVLGVVVAVIVIGAGALLAFSSTGDSEDKEVKVGGSSEATDTSPSDATDQTDASTDKSTATTAKKAEVKPGLNTPVPSDDLIFTALALTDPYKSPNQFESPKPGNRFVRVELKVENTTGTSANFSSFGQVKLRDTAGHTFSPTFVSGDGVEVDGEIPAKAFNRGFVYFELQAETAGPFDLQVQGKAFTGKAKLIALA